MSDMNTGRVCSLHPCWMQALTLYLVWDEEAELSEEDTVLTSLLTGSDEDSDDETGKKPEKAQRPKAAADKAEKSKNKKKKKESEDESDDDDDEGDTEDSAGMISASIKVD